jgi:hypothetical protein
MCVGDSQGSFRGFTMFLKTGAYAREVLEDSQPGFWLVVWNHVPSSRNFDEGEAALGVLDDIVHCFRRCCW